MLDHTLLHRENRPAKVPALNRRSYVPNLANLDALPDAILAPSGLPRASAPRLATLAADVPLNEASKFVPFRF